MRDQSLAPKESEIDPFRNQPELTQEDSHTLVKIAASNILLPHPGVVEQFEGAIWPVIRDGAKRYTVNDEKTLVFDDNMLARWALLWSHGFTQTGFPKGWTLAHVWADSKEVTSFTSLPNLALMPEYFGSMSDKNGPLAAALQWHSFSIFGWKPKDFPMPEKPYGFENIAWKYLPFQDDAAALVSATLAKSNSKAANAVKRVLAGSPNL